MKNKQKMGICATKSTPNRQVKQKIDILQQFMSLTHHSQIEEIFDQLKGESILEISMVFETLIQSQPEFTFYNESIEQANQLFDRLHNYIQNYYIHALREMNPMNRQFIDNSTLRIILEVYLAIQTLRKGKEIWWNQDYYYYRIKITQKQMTLAQKVVGRSTISPIINYIFVLMKLVEKRLRLKNVKESNSQQELVCNALYVELMYQIQENL